jgi:hypothetical protein
MRLRAFLGLALLPLAGCGAIPGANLRSSAEQAKLPDRKPDLDSRTNLGLIREERILRVGDDPDVGLDLFPKSMAQNSFDVHDLPKVFPNPPYSATGWDSPSGDGFGEIVYDRRMAAAIRTELCADQAAADEKIATYRRNLGVERAVLPAPASPGAVPAPEGLKYFFWEAAPQQRLMILEKNLPAGKVRLTIAVGDVVVLDGLGINLTGAKQDLGILAHAATTKK